MVEVSRRGRRGSAAPGGHMVGSGVAELLRDADRPAGWLLTVDGVPQSYVDTADPTYLEFDYVRWMAEVIDGVAEPGAPLSVVHVGGAGLTLPRYVAATRPRSRQVVAEPDERLTALVRAVLPLPKAAGIRVRGADGRSVLAGMPAGSADVVAVDAFAGGRVPASLVSREFLFDVARVLRPDGRYVANIADGPPLRFARCVVATVLGVLEHGMLVAEPAVLRGRRFGNLVVAASSTGLPVTDLARRSAGTAFRARVVAAEALWRFTAGASAFTDADAVSSPEAPAGTWGPG